MNAPFKFKHFEVHQSDSAMKVGMDAMLLGALSEIKDEQNILDIGGGTGVLSLMLAQQRATQINNLSFKITAIEIDEKAAIEADLNFKRSPWAKHLQVIRQSFDEFLQNNTDLYDFIISNPPFFNGGLEAHQRGTKMENSRKVARISHHLNLSEIFRGVNQIMSDNGVFYFIYPYQNHDEILELSNQYQLFPVNIIFVKSFKEGVPIRGIYAFKKTRNACMESELIIYESHRVYSAQYRELTKEFHGTNI